METSIKSLRRVTFGRTTIPESWIFSGGDEAKAVPIILSVFLIETQKEKILVDAGCNTMPGFAVEDHIGPVAALRNMGIDVAEITGVILTHAHHDHAESVSAFPNATVYVQKLEWEGAKRFILQQIPVVTFEDCYQVLDGVRIVCSGGHSPGSCVVECNYKGGQYVLCGDECYSMYNIYNRVPTATSCNPEKSRFFIEKYANSQNICLLCHQREDNQI